MCQYNCNQGEILLLGLRKPHVGAISPDKSSKIVTDKLRSQGFPNWKMKRNNYWKVSEIDSTILRHMKATPLLKTLASVHKAVF